MSKSPSASDRGQTTVPQAGAPATHAAAANGKPKRKRHKESPRERTLAAAVKVFSEHGFDAATLRQITDEANVNIAAVNYYFSSKDELVRVVLEQLVWPIEARGELLDKFEIEAAGKPLSVEKIVEAIVRPTVELSHFQDGGRPLIRLMLQARALPRAETTRFFTERVDPIAKRFVAALTRALPDVSEAEIYWRYNFSLGALMQILTDSDPKVRRLKIQSGGLCDTDDDTEVVVQLVRYISAGFRAASLRS